MQWFVRRKPAAGTPAAPVPSGHAIASLRRTVHDLAVKEGQMDEEIADLKRRAITHRDRGELDAGRFLMQRVAVHEQRVHTLRAQLLACESALHRAENTLVTSVVVDELQACAAEVQRCGERLQSDVVHDVLDNIDEGGHECTELLEASTSEVTASRDWDQALRDLDLPVATPAAARRKSSSTAPKAASIRFPNVPTRAFTPPQGPTDPPAAAPPTLAQLEIV